MDKLDVLYLKKRYLIWLYKTTKEAIDRVERKFTQTEIDNFILRELQRLDKKKRAKKFIQEWEDYIQVKKEEGSRLKYEGDDVNSQHYFLSLKLKAIENAVTRAMGSKALKKIKSLYEQEMIERIMKSTHEK